MTYYLLWISPKQGWSVPVISVWSWRSATWPWWNPRCGYVIQCHSTCLLWSSSTLNVSSDCLYIYCKCSSCIFKKTHWSSLEKQSIIYQITWVKSTREKNTGEPVVCLKVLYNEVTRPHFRFFVLIWFCDLKERRSLNDIKGEFLGSKYITLYNIILLMQILFIVLQK